MPPYSLSEYRWQHVLVRRGVKSYILSLEWHVFGKM